MAQPANQTRRASTSRSVPGLGMFVLLSALAIGAYGLWKSSPSILLLGSAVATSAALLIPIGNLPSLSLWLLVLVPIGYMDTEAGVARFFGRFFSPAVIVIAIWLIRLFAAQRKSDSSMFRSPIKGWPLVAAIFPLMLLSTMASRTQIVASFEWIAVATICLVLPALVGQVRPHNEWPQIQKTFAAIGLFLGALAVLDYFVGFNPWTELFRYSADNAETTVFRTRLSLGHPLAASTVASVAFGVCMFASVERRKWPYWLCGAGALIATVLTVSRTGVISLALGTAVGVVTLFFSKSNSQHRPPTDITRTRSVRSLATLAITGVLLSVALASPLLSARNESSGGIKSANYRSSAVDNALALIADRPILGYGPGTSVFVFQESYGGILENSGLQLFLSLGVPAAVLAVSALAAIVISAMRSSQPGVAASMVAFLMGITGYNALDSNTAMLALAAPLVFCAVRRPASDRTGTSAE